jgi:hypothetical protein
MAAGEVSVQRGITSFLKGKTDKEMRGKGQEAVLFSGSEGSTAVLIPPSDIGMFERIGSFIRSEAV